MFVRPANLQSSKIFVEKAYSRGSLAPLVWDRINVNTRSAVALTMIEFNLALTGLFEWLEVAECEVELVSCFVDCRMLVTTESASAKGGCASRILMTKRTD